MINFLTRIVVYLVVPLLGILVWGWDWRSILVLYWLENVTVGLQTIIRIIRTPKLFDESRSSSIQQRAERAKRFEVTIDLGGFEKSNNFPKPVMIIFFIVHYGIFTFVHGVFVFVLVSGFLGIFQSGQLRSPLDGLINTVGIQFGPVLAVWLFGTLIQVAHSLYEDKSTLPSVQELFMSPYKRIFALHLTIIVGVGLILFLNWPAVAAILLVGLHFLFDSMSFRKELRSNPEPGRPRQQ